MSAKTPSVLGLVASCGRTNSMSHHLTTLVSDDPPENSKQRSGFNPGFQVLRNGSRPPTAPTETPSSSAQASTQCWAPGPPGAGLIPGMCRVLWDGARSDRENGELGVGQNNKQELDRRLNRPSFHLPGLHLGYLFLTHNQR